VWTGDAEPTPVSSNAPSSQPPPSIEPRPADAERRQLTVEFIDLVGSTTLSAQLDPEEFREVVRAYQETCAQVIHRYEGHIAQYLGDGLLVYFGYPTAHEDDAARAIRAGLEIIAALQKQVPSPLVGEGQGEGVVGATGRSPLQVRIGVHTGPVVVGAIGGGGRQEQLALGETPNIAARIQSQAAPDEVVISAATYRLVEGLFVCEDRGRPELKRVAAPLRLYRVVKEGEAQNRFQVVVRKGLTPLVGREHEYGLLRERWQRVQDGAGQVVLLSGEPGIGKSRLVEALKETVAREGAPCLELRCSPYYQNSALYPIIDHLQRLLQFVPEEPPDAKLEKLEQRLLRYRFPQPETLLLLAALLSLPSPAGAPSLTLSSQKQKERTLETSVSWLMEETERGPLACAWEDLHWADPSTLELLTLLLEQVPTTRMLVLLTFRPEFTPPWGARAYLSQVNLSRLALPQVEIMVGKVAGGKALPKEVVRQIASKTDGVPLFVEELTKMVVESDLLREVDGRYELNGPLPPLAIPSTLQDSLMARLDRLATVRDIAQVGATIGREFTYDLLKTVSPLKEETLQQGLRQLVDAELIYQQGVPPQARYLFKHALVQETAYQSLLKSRRQQLHQHLARVLVEQFPQTVETQPELVARHYTEAGLTKQAIPYWQQAGQRASQRSANTEALSHLTKGLELLKTLPESPQRTEQELSIQMDLAAALVYVKGLGAHEARAAYDRAWQLCQQSGDSPHLMPVLIGLSNYYLQQNALQKIKEIGEPLLALAEQQHDRKSLLLAYRVLQSSAYWGGDFRRAHEYAELGVQLYDPHSHSSAEYALDLRILFLCIGAWALWYLGYPDQALHKSRHALALARELAHPYSLAWALNAASWMHIYRGEGRAACAFADEAIAFSAARDFPHWVAMGTMMRGIALGELGQWQEGVTVLKQGNEAYWATGAVLGREWAISQVAKLHAQGRQIAEGLAVIAESLSFLHNTEVRFSEAEIYRIKGELLWLQAGQRQARIDNRQVEREAEEWFVKAVMIAQKQQAKSLELCAATSLARLWQQQGKRQEAHRMLAEIYNWFTEGFDTKDLQEAKALIEELSH
ncbi:MAG TPA: adenylate/guanylate cyclase domain-containing protein, partial [Methylomirabilota bacterium]|nr:adenylate/guanylate cyclase domain-containing protein [Methylomirabilota bacterium]